MRVIAGKARRLNLITPKGEDTRPTTDRVKETLFNILQPSLYGCRFLDLFAGSGAIGIEALSRGAKEAVFVDSGRDAQNCIKQNLAHTKLAPQGKLMECDVFTAIRKLSDKPTFDVVFMDPPYDTDLIYRVLDAIKDTDIVDQDTLIVAESNLEKDFSFADELGYEIIREKEYKTNKHIFITLKDFGGRQA